MTAYHIQMLKAKGHYIISFAIVDVGIKKKPEHILLMNAYICLQ